MTSRPGVFAGGSLIRSGGLVVTAVRDGRNAAEAIDRFLARTPQEVGPFIEEGHHPGFRRLTVR
jgi:hypothetical protein